MKEYTIIIVDDEKEIAEGIIQKIDFQKYGFAVIGAAENGQDAYELALKLQPDIIMTDIVMPYMDGLQLAEELLEQLPETKFIVFSGYDDLEYAHRAIKLDISEYVLKPVNANELIAVLTKLKKQLDDEYESKHNYEMLQKHYQNSIPIIKEMLLCNLMDGKVSDEEFHDKAQLTGITLSSCGYHIALFEMEENENGHVQSIFREKNDVMRMATLKQLICDKITKRFSCHVFFYGNEIAAICNTTKDNTFSELLVDINEACNAAKKIYDITLSAGISKRCQHIMMVCSACKEAQIALDYQMILGSGKAIYIDDVNSDATKSISFQGPDEERLLMTIRIKTEQEIEEAVHNIFQKLYDQLLPLEAYRIYAMEIMTAILKLLETYHIEQNAIFPTSFNPYQPLDNVDGLEHFQLLLTSVCKKIAKQIRKARIHTSVSIVEQAVEYIQAHYHQMDLTVETISREFHISASYLATLFKREMEESAIVYINNLRLKEALRLLETTNKKSYEIAEQVGYSDANYFSYVFKKKYGVSPNKYRTKQSVNV